jgi:hypothetical protein
MSRHRSEEAPGLASAALGLALRYERSSNVTDRGTAPWAVIR